MREYTNSLLGLIEEGMIDTNTVLIACLKYMSEQDVKCMMELNGFENEVE